jgi:hypothetical protein
MKRMDAYELDPLSEQSLQTQPCSVGHGSDYNDGIVALAAT